MRATGKIDLVSTRRAEPVNRNWLIGSVGALVVLFGVVLMHSAPMPFTSATGIGEHSMTSSIPTPLAASDHSTAPSAPAMDDASATHCGNGCSDHGSVLHLCLAIAGAAIAALAALRAVVVGFAGSLVHAARVWTVRHRTGPPPPWTVLSLSELSVLRI